MPRETKYMVVPKGSFSISSLGDFLNNFYWTDGQEANFFFNKVKRCGFYIPHKVITQVTSTYPDWEERVKFFSQEGEAKVRKYSIPDKKKSAEEKRVNIELKKIIEKKKTQQQ